MKNYSVWNEYLKNSFKELNEDIECDVLIIGGGISGILTAFNLRDTNLKVVLVERNRIGSGITSKMTAKVTILQDILTKISNNNLKLYLKSQIDGFNILKNNIERLNIECDFIKNDSYLYTNKKSNLKKIKKIENLFNELKINYKEENIPIKELNSLLSIKIDNSYVINPIKYINSLVNNLSNISIYENTNIIEVTKEKKVYISKTNNNKIIAKKIIFATNYPYFIKPLLFPLKVRLEKSLILYGNSNYKEKFNLINIDKDIYSIRFYKNKMIYLSNSKYLSHSNNIKDFKTLINNKLIKNIDNYWSNIDIITNDYLPIIGKVFNDMYIITGFNSWGILSSHIGASMLASIILNKKKYLKYKELFDPRRKITFQKVTNSSINIFENMNGYFKGMITKNKSIFYSKNEAMYIDRKGYCYTVKRKCPHMKCNLIFNEIESSWDCPCHGSRFDIQGNIISGPSKYDIK